MKIKYKIVSVVAFTALLLIGGCKDFLHVESDTQNVTNFSFKTMSDLRAATGFLYDESWFQFNNNGYIILEGRAANIAGAVTGTIPLLASFMADGNINEVNTVWQSLYNVVTQSDYVINNYAPIARGNNLDTTEVNACEGEARFMRATAYWYLAMIWHDVPIIDDPEKYVKNYSVYPNEFEDVIQYAINDLTYAVNVLPLTDDAGRVTKYSAEGMLARLCLTAADYAAGGHFSSEYLARNKVSSNDELAQLYFSQVKTLTNDVIVNGGQYGLMDDYEELFRVQNNNNKESLFSLQFVPNSTTYGLGNDIQRFIAYSQDLVGKLNAYGGSTFVSYDIVHLSALDKGMSRSRANFFINGQKYSYLSYLTTTAYAANNGKSNIKKQVIGSPADAGGMLIEGNSGFMSPMLRMADVYLMYTEACMGTATSTSDQTAVDRYNAVHKRAFYYYTKNNLPNPYYAKTVIERDTLFKERRLEFFMENLFWPDIVRRSFYDLNWVTSYLNNTLYQPGGYTLVNNGTLQVQAGQYDITNPKTSLTNFKIFVYSYDPTAAGNNLTIGFSTNSPRLDASFSYWGTAYHNDVTGSYAHAPNMDNIWSLPYPISEVTSDPLLIEKPIKYKF
ncbi:MAG TPA: RagB/SusD family nutrient uptake outer membrane protein [Bacteroidales bacterium]